MRITVRVSGTRAECEAVAAGLTGTHLPGLGQVVDATRFRPDTRPGPPARAVTTDAVADLAPVVGFTGLAAAAGIETSTLRAYQARGQAGLPAPDVAIGGRRYWRRATATAWLTARARLPALGRIDLSIRPTPHAVRSPADHTRPSTQSPTREEG